MKIYQSNARVQQQTGGGGFNPVREPDVASAMEQELRQGERRDQAFYNSIEANNREMVDNATAFARKSNADIEQNLKARSKFSETLGQVAEGIETQRRQEQYGNETFSFLDRGAQYLDGNPTALTAPEEDELRAGEQNYEENDQIGNFVSQTANSTDDPITARAVRQTVPSPQMVGSERIKLLNAQSNFAGYLAQYVAGNATVMVGGQRRSIKELANSGDPALVNIAVQAGTSQFLRDFGLTSGVSRYGIARYLSNTIVTSQSSILRGLVTAGIKNSQEETAGLVNNTLIQAARAGEQDLQTLFTDGSNRNWTLDAGFGTRREANIATATSIASGLIANGDVEGIKALADVQVIPGQAGSELRFLVGAELVGWENQARQQRNNNEKGTYDDITTQMYTQLSGVQGLTERTKIVNATATRLEQAGLFEEARTLRNQASALSTQGGAEVNAVQVEAQILSGGDITVQDLTQMRLAGSLTQQDYDRMVRTLNSRNDAKAPNDQNIKEIVSGYGDKFQITFMTAAGLQRNPTTGQVSVRVDGQPLVSPADAGLITDAAEMDMNRVVNQIVRQNQGKSQLEIEAAVREGLNSWWIDNVVSDGGKYRLSDLVDLDDPKLTDKGIDEFTRGQKDRFGSILTRPTDTVLPGIGSSVDSVIAPRDLTGYVNPGVRPSTDTRARYDGLRGDRVFMPSEVKEFADQVKKGEIPKNLITVAEGLGVSPMNLLNQQLSAYPQLGIKPFTFERQAPQATSAGSGNYNNMVDGAKRLMTLNFPPKSAAYLAGNIMQESAWNGQRSWGEVMNDGSDRNGGLVSWMDGKAHGNFRLTRIEQHLGKPINQATDDEQLQAMVWEMREYYPEAFRIFRNPMSTPRQLRRASRQYWGYGHEGARYSYANQIISQL